VNGNPPWKKNGRKSSSCSTSALSSQGGRNSIKLVDASCGLEYRSDEKRKRNSLLSEEGTKHCRRCRLRVASRESEKERGDGARRSCDGRREGNKTTGRHVLVPRAGRGKRKEGKNKHNKTTSTVNFVLTRSTPRVGSHSFRPVSSENRKRSREGKKENKNNPKNTPHQPTTTKTKSSHRTFT